MQNLDNLEAIEKLDESNLLGSIKALGKQIKQMWEEVQLVNFPDAYKEVDKIVVCGMGGSALGAEIIKSLYFSNLQVVMQIVKGYHLPPFVDQHTLVILSSYSGSTEETLSCGADALKKGAKIVGIATGSKLEKFCQERRFPFVRINPVNNPCSQPRMGIGYSILSQFGILKKLNLITIGDGEIEKIIYILEENNKLNGVETPEKENQAKQIARELYDKLPILLSSEFMFGTSYAIRNQMNENAKHFAFIYEIPEINHHLMEGLQFPNSNNSNLIFLILNSEFYDDNNRIRLEITKEILKQNKIKWVEFSAKSESPLFQVFETLGFGSYLNFYLAMLNGLNPSPIPYVDFFKNELVKRRGN